HSVHRRKRRSREQHCSRQPSHRGFPATASTAPDPPLQRSASSIPPQNHQENLSSARVFTHPGSSPDQLTVSHACSIATPSPPTGDMPREPHATHTMCHKETKSPVSACGCVATKQQQARLPK